MKRILDMIKPAGLLSISLWIAGSAILFDENNGPVIIVISGVIVFSQLSKRIKKDKAQA